jgi:hypothetical protein
MSNQANTFTAEVLGQVFVLKYTPLEITTDVYGKKYWLSTYFSKAFSELQNEVNATGDFQKAQTVKSLVNNANHLTEKGKRFLAENVKLNGDPLALYSAV